MKFDWLSVGDFCRSWTVLNAIHYLLGAVVEPHSVLALVAATFSAALAVAAAVAGAVRLVPSGRDVEFRAGKSLWRYVACPVYSRKSGLLGRSYAGDEVVSSGDLALL